MIGFAKVGSDPFAVQAGDNIFWIDAININWNQPFTRRIVNAANDMNMRHFSKARQIASAVDHGIG